MSSTSIKSIFDEMSYPVTLTGNDLCKNCFSDFPKERNVRFVDNVYETGNYNHLPDDFKLAISKEPWKDPVNRATLLFKLSEEVGKKKNLFACVESGTAEKPLARTMERDIPELVDHLNKAAQAVCNCPEGWEPHGVVGVLVEDTNSPSLCQSLQLGPALAAGNAVVLCLAQDIPHTAFLLAKTASDVGFPAGILNVACNVPDSIIESFDLVLGSGIQPAVNFSSILKWNAVAKPKAIVTENADLQSAAQGIIQLSSFNSSMSSSSGAVVLVQESIYEEFWKEIESIFKRLLPTTSVFEDNGDVYFHLCCEDSTIRKTNVNDTIAEGAEVVYPRDGNDTPLLVRGIKPTSPLLGNKSVAGAQIIWIQSFRHSKEAVTLANGFPFTDHVSIWGEQASILLDISKDLTAHNIWINTQNVIDPAGEFDVSVFLSRAGPESAAVDSLPELDDTYRTDITKDLKSAVASARIAHKKWSSMGVQCQSQLLFSLADKFKCQEEALHKLVQSSNLAKDIGQLYKYASQIGFSGFKPKSSSSSTAKCWSWESPHGVVGVVLPRQWTFQLLVASVGAALASGNALVAVIYESGLSSLCRQVISSSGLPAGLVCLIDTQNVTVKSTIELLSANIDAAWILSSQYSKEYVDRPDLMTGTLPIAQLDVSQYNWDTDSSHVVIRDWLQKQSTKVKKIWFECPSSI